MSQRNNVCLLCLTYVCLDVTKRVTYMFSVAGSSVQSLDDCLCEIAQKHNVVLRNTLLKVKTKTQEF